MSDPVRVVAVVSGRVQGVGYRYFVREAATAAGVAGSATNLSDGRVEVVLEGPNDAIERVVAELDGPRAPGHPTGVQIRRALARGVAGFTTK